MAENRMAEIAKMYGLEIGEEFYIKFPYDDIAYKLNTYTFTTDGLMRDGQECNGMIGTLLTGGACIIKKQWKPEMGKHYWFVGIDGDPVETYWMGIMRDHALYATGNCFRTENGAFDHREEVVACMKSIYENGVEEQKSEKPSAEEAAKVLKEYCAGRDCNHCKFCIDKENVEGCRLRDTPEIWPI